MLPSSGYRTIPLKISSHARIYNRARARNACGSAYQRASKWKTSNSRKTEVLRPLGLTVPYLKINRISCSFRYSWLARLAFKTATFRSSSVWFAWFKWAGTGRSSHLETGSKFALFCFFFLLLLLSLPHTWGKSWANCLARRLAQLFHQECGWVFVSFSPREAVRKISVVFDIWDFASRGEILTKTQPQTWGNSSADCLGMPRKAVCSALSSSVRQALSMKYVSCHGILSECPRSVW